MSSFICILLDALLEEYSTFYVLLSVIKETSGVQEYEDIEPTARHFDRFHHSCPAPHILCIQINFNFNTEHSLNLSDNDWLFPTTTGIPYKCFISNYWNAIIGLSLG